MCSGSLAAGCPFAASSCAGCPGTSGLSAECLFTDFSRLKCPCKGCLCKSCHFAFVRNVIMRDLSLQDSVQDVLLRDYRLQDVHLRNVCKPNVHMRDVSIQNVHEIYVSFKMSACCMSVCKNSVLR